MNFNPTDYEDICAAIGMIDAAILWLDRVEDDEFGSIGDIKSDLSHIRREIDCLRITTLGNCISRPHNVSDILKQEK